VPFVESLGLTPGVDHLGCREGVDTCRRFSLLGVQTEYGDFGEARASNVRPSALLGYGRRCRGHTSPCDAMPEGKFLLGDRKETGYHFFFHCLHDYCKIPIYFASLS